MNERIQELAELCGFRPSPSIYDRNQSFDIEKFAELIVEECIEINKQELSFNAFDTLTTRYQEHFGVES